VLPLSPELDEMLVTGASADAIEHQLGGWTNSTPSVEGVTVREGIEAAVSDDTTVTHEQGSGVRERANVDTATEPAADADAAVVVLGEDASIHEFIPTNMTAEHTGRVPDPEQVVVAGGAGGVTGVGVRGGDADRAGHGDRPTVGSVVGGRPRSGYPRGVLSVPAWRAGGR